MEDDWLCIEDDDSHYSGSDSDIIDSETEAELYSTIHYEENLTSFRSQNVNIPTSELTVKNSNLAIQLTQNKMVVCTEVKRAFTDDDDRHLKRKESVDRNENLKNKFEDLSPTKKQKLDHVQASQSINLCSSGSNDRDRDLNEIFRHNSLNHVSQNTKSDKSSPAKQSLRNGNSSSMMDSSDSDSIIWTELDSTEKTDFKTNLMKDMDSIYLASDSDDESSLVERESNLKNMSMPNIKMGQSSEGLWHINDEDIYRPKKYSRRYHENIFVTCSNCNKKGHTVRTCPIPKIIKCFICGGSHLGSRCVNRICSNCYTYGHDRRRCQMRKNNFYCMLCSVRGHIKENCPDLWRRYHLTTEPVKVVKGKRVKQDTNMYCWNCGDQGHFGGVCQGGNYRTLTTWPCVVSYDDPGELLKSRVNNKKNRNRMRLKKLLNKRGNIIVNVSKGKKDEHLRQINEVNIADDFKKERKAGNKRKKRLTKGCKHQMKKEMQRNLKVLRESDFPRTPKPEIPQQSEVPESVQLAIKQKLKKRRQNQKRKLKRQQILTKVNTGN